MKKVLLMGLVLGAILAVLPHNAAATDEQQVNEDAKVAGIKVGG